MVRLPASLSTARLRRRILLLTYSTLLLFLFALTIIFVVLFSNRSNYSVANRTTLISDFIAGSTWLLAFIAAFIALQAYAAATGLPEIKLQIWFNNSAKNQPIFRVSRLADGTMEAKSPTGQTLLSISLLNQGKYSARGPAVKIQLHGMRCRFSAAGTEWAAIGIGSDGGVQVIQWDGGSEYAIHGGFARQLPAVDLGRVYGISDAELPNITFSVVSDNGYRRVLKIPVVLIGDGLLSSPNAIIGRTAEWL